MKLLILILLVLTACSSPPRTTPDGLVCFWDRTGAGVERTMGICHKNGVALTCFYEKDATPQVTCATGCVPLESK